MIRSEVEKCPFLSDIMIIKRQFKLWGIRNYRPKPMSAEQLGDSGHVDI
ncbi:unnamed protein product [marine sediment metagenome]|uniref:Uncharacterized protein n=1 Tax=marine sediment metagenome TaxID=412755 RepID=X0Z5H1_9ZZZZ